jgi:hypothetical protein
VPSAKGRLLRTFPCALRKGTFSDSFPLNVKPLRLFSQEIAEVAQFFWIFGGRCRRSSRGLLQAIDRKASRSIGAAGFKPA